jgi:hypothetical protein
VYYSGSLLAISELFLVVDGNVNLHQITVFIVVIIRAYCVPQTSGVCTLIHTQICLLIFVKRFLLMILNNGWVSEGRMPR